MPSSGLGRTPLPLQAAKSLARNVDGASDPQLWLSWAERLFYGGEQLWAVGMEHWPAPKPERHPAAPAQFEPAFLLFGYAFENALKGLIVQALVSASKTAVKNGKLDGVLNSHDICMLARRAHVTLTPAGEDLLARLKEHVVWAGRYPVMKDVSGFTPGQLVPNARLAPETDLALVREFFERILARYDRKHYRLL
jgi:hypothetical protein